MPAFLADFFSYVHIIFHFDLAFPTKAEVASWVICFLPSKELLNVGSDPRINYTYTRKETGQQLRGGQDLIGPGSKTSF